MMPNGKDRYSAFHTWSEIISQGEAWSAVLDEVNHGESLERIAEACGSAKKVIFVGCGTSYYLAEAAAVTWSALTGQPANAIPGSEVLLFPDRVRVEGSGVKAIAISRSGQTSETVRAAHILRQELKIPTFGISCAHNSNLEKDCEHTIVLNACDEKSTVMTRSFTGMLLALQCLAARVGRKQQFVTDLRTIADQFVGTNRIRSFGDLLEEFTAKHRFENFVFLGQGAFYGIAREGSLKLMEMSCSYSEFFHTLEFRHGPKAIVNPKTCLTFFLSDSAGEAEAEVLAEMKELGGTTIAICNRLGKTNREAADLVIEMNAPVHELALLAPYTVPGQLFGFFEGVRKGLNPDEPKNLARVVILD